MENYIIKSKIEGLEKYVKHLEKLLKGYNEICIKKDKIIESYIEIINKNKKV